MEKSLEPLYGAGGETSGGFPSCEGMFSGVSLPSILTMNPSIFPDSASALPPSSSFTFQNDELPLLLNHRELDVSLDYQLMNHGRLNQDLFCVPKLELLQFLSEAASTGLSTEQTNDFLPMKSQPAYYDDSFARLPELSSLEPMLPDSLTHNRLWCFGAVGCNTQYRKVDYSKLVQKNFQTPMISQTLSNNGGDGDTSGEVSLCRTKKQRLSSPLQKEASPAKETPAVGSVVPQSNLAHQRRQKLSDKTQYLQKLLPWNNKMDMATMLEETYKYVKFLQAQLCALKSMPNDSGSAIAERHCGRNEDRFGRLEKLNRNQLLQVLVNSPVAQTLLYSQKCCVFSVEQIALICNVSEKRFLRQMVMVDTSTTHVSSKSPLN